MNHLSKAQLAEVVIDSSAAGQRLDNFLLALCKGVPKSHIYRIVRSGEVRVNSRRAEPMARLQEGDRIRIPPMRVAAKTEATESRGAGREFPVLYEDESLLIVDKPAGTAVHGGSGISMGVIEALRLARPQQKFLELVHRLDRETSGILLLAKRRPALLGLHAALREGRVDKRYVCLALGRWRHTEKRVSLSLAKFMTAASERRVAVQADGQEAHTVFRKLRYYPGFTLVEAQLETGRTHQIRVHLAHLGHCLAGDDKYGDFELNRRLTKSGLKRMFLHAASLKLAHPETGQILHLESALPPELQQFLDQLERDGQIAAPV